MGCGADWNEIIQTLGYPGNLFAPDLPGHGTQKEAFEQSGDAIIKRWGRGLWEKLDRHPVVVGYSLGGRLALELSCSFPMKALFLCSTSLGIRGDQRRSERVKKDSQWASSLTCKWGSAFLKQWYEQPIFKGIHRKRHRFERLIRRRLDHGDPRDLEQGHESL